MLKVPLTKRKVKPLPASQTTPDVLKTPAPKTGKGKRILSAKRPAIHEPQKQALFVKGPGTSPVFATLLHDLYSLKKPMSTLFTNKQLNSNLRPWEDVSPIELLITKADPGTCFCLSTTSTKRHPASLTLTRTFDNHVLDQVELCINPDSIQTISQIGCKETCSVGTVPLMLFIGTAWECHDQKRLQNMLLDLFRPYQKQVSNLDSNQIQKQSRDFKMAVGLECVIAITASDTDPCQFKWRTMRIKLLQTKAGEKDFEMFEMGPCFDFSIGRIRFPTEELWKEACKQPLTVKNQDKKVKNVEWDEVGAKYGRIHVGKQDLSKLQTRKTKALKVMRKMKQGSQKEEGSEEVNVF